MSKKLGLWAKMVWAGNYFHLRLIQVSITKSWSNFVFGPFGQDQYLGDIWKIPNFRLRYPPKCGHGLSSFKIVDFD